MTTDFPDWVEPMAATLTQDRFTGPEWVFERKFDGIRLLAFKQGAGVRLLSRNRLPHNYPPLVEAIASLPVDDVILDGEITHSTRGDESARSGQAHSTRGDESARSGQAHSTRGDESARSLRLAGAPSARSGQAGQASAGFAYHVFDIMWLDGRDVTSLSLDERRALLSNLPLRSPLRRVAALDDPQPWERACREGWEGVIAKRRDSRYEHRRSPHWLKMKCEAAQAFVVGGFTDPQGGRVGLGALLVGYFEDDDVAGQPKIEDQEMPRRLVFAGKVGTGFDTRLLLDLRAQLDALEIQKPPFGKAVGLPRLRAHWVRPEIIVQVAFIEWTVHGKLRHSRLLGVRNDKPASEVVREMP